MQQLIIRAFKTTFFCCSGKMIYLKLSIALLFFLSSCNTSARETVLTDDSSINGNKEYKLVWAEEFDTKGTPNPKDWKFEKGFVRNNELQWYQEKNAYVADGMLIIEGRREKFPNPNYNSKSTDWKLNRDTVHYTSASINTGGLHSWTYGRFEIRAKIKAEKGLWPAIWTVGEGQEWPQGGEIDILEFYSGKILANAAWAGKERWKAIWDGFSAPVEDFGQNWSDKFHVWRMDWTSEFIKIYVDDQLLNTVALDSTINQFGTIKNPFRETKQYILLNLAIGSNGGDPGSTVFPSQYIIDYVRVYQLK
jgi:beta-glucanase (GH16 family)